jgi:hypothetical protein
MEKKFQELSNWTFWIDERSSGCYNVKGQDEVFGCNLDLTGDDPEDLLDRARRSAHEMERQIRDKLHSRFD